MSSPIENDQVVTMHYTLTNDAGEVLDSSEDRDPLAYLHGHSNIVPGLEKALAGKTVGEKIDVVVPPEEGYGPKDESRIGKVPRAQIEVESIAPGMILRAESPEGPMMLTVVEVTDDEVTLDANHELAGVSLHFAVEIVSIRAAEKTEIEHGHVH